ncbi:MULTISPECIES: DUF2155 domain-containing protein [Acetobacter]|uniref:DUF2155 domain-containing protein n=1 Tax=Acetobacter thailandicus TaxID=1502842 RepID=A0ABT3QD93_9PROT|nr:MULTISPECIES: DUF2155 domain-containing protein [Acetobacter]MBS0960305.1 DUF2155 domain-containing protein [Acetobacter thailandicus]MBS0979674.1 DUF2155 domain-containing protein [Acetobacter thailandicus]MBS0985520.1 DUF2155 domain-containing protein [Acetobacter thailandicus]MBS1003243.1 DUF2155 domain-containing protein [Acetobacter thailandicus]MCX2563245.1 DUF2155 domain-containing protein [Acetobacter thailandicus]
MRRSVLHKNTVFIAGCFITAVAPVSAALAQLTPLAPPAIYPADTWQGKSVAVVRVLDRLDAHVELVTVPVGTTGHYKSLDITPRRCLQRPPTLSPDSAAWLDLHDTRKEGAVFNGWMLEAEPWAGVFESAGYDVRMVRCEGQDASPALPALPVPAVPSLRAAPPTLDGSSSGSALQSPAEALPSPSAGPETGGEY